MKNFIFLFTGLLAMSFHVNAFITKSNPNIIKNTHCFIFKTNGVEFSVFADGQFDFYLKKLSKGDITNINHPKANISFNAGYNYDDYTQYDDYGAIVQIENVPIYYDYYGRISQAGNIYIDYNNYGRISKIGGLQITYNDQGDFIDNTGRINNYNKSYKHHPFHTFFRAPITTKRVVYHKPYRKFYTPYRYSYKFHKKHYTGWQHNKPYILRRYAHPNDKRIRYYSGIVETKARNISYRNRDRRDALYTTSYLRFHNKFHSKNYNIVNYRYNRSSSRYTSRNSFTNKRFSYWTGYRTRYKKIGYNFPQPSIPDDRHEEDQ